MPEEVTPIPSDRNDPLDIPAGYHALLDSGEVRKARCPSGIDGWLVTRYDEVRSLLLDAQHFSNRMGPDVHVNALSLKIATEYPPEQRLGSDLRPGNFIRTDPPRHTTTRRRAAGYLGPRQMQDFAPVVEDIVHGLIDNLATGPNPTDLVKNFASLVSSMSVTTLIGASDDDRDLFLKHIHVSEDHSTSTEEKAAARQGLYDYINSIVKLRMAKPTNDLISHIILAEADSPEPLGEQGITDLAQLLFFAGHATTASQIALSVYTLMRYPDQKAKLQEHPELLDQAVEELIRYLTIVQYGVPRLAACPAKVDDAEIPEGDVAVALLPAANRDPNKFDAPDAFDITRTRSQNPHVGFGYGPHQCIGQHLARLELKVALRALMDRVPTLRLATAPENLEFDQHDHVYGIKELPVAWEEVLPR